MKFNGHFFKKETQKGGVRKCSVTTIWAGLQLDLFCWDAS